MRDLSAAIDEKGENFAKGILWDVDELIEVVDARRSLFESSEETALDRGQGQRGREDIRHLARPRDPWYRVGDSSL